MFQAESSWRVSGCIKLFLQTCLNKRWKCYCLVYFMEPIINGQIRGNTNNQWQFMGSYSSGCDIFLKEFQAFSNSYPNGE